ncbi:MAG: hypothetical protein WC314_15775 [Vulcanimicrobiota bacterium]
MEIQRSGYGVGAAGGGYQPSQAGGAGEAGASKETEEASGSQAAAGAAQQTGQIDSFQQCPGSIKEAQESNAHNSIDKVAQFQQANS